MRATIEGRKAAMVWRAMHLSVVATLVGILAAVLEPESANGIGIMLGSFQVALGGFVSVYCHSQGKVDEKHGPTPRPSGAMRAVVEES